MLGWVHTESCYVSCRKADQISEEDFEDQIRYKVEKFWLIIPLFHHSTIPARR
jgi:hypothetical protein